MLFTGKCPVCEGNVRLLINTDGYNEPPENLSTCEDCGYSEYYSYYEGYSSYMKVYFKTETGFELVKLCNVYDSEYIEPEIYKKKLLKFLDKMNLTTQDLINMNKEYKEFLKKEKKEKLKKKIDESKRWELNNLTQEEKEKVHKFIEDKKRILEKFQDLGIVTEISFVTNSEGLLEDFAYKVNELKLSEYEDLKIQAQRSYCRENKIPVFASSSCFGCNSRIFSLQEKKELLFGKTYSCLYEYIPMEEASSSLITGCPCCNRSYVD